MRLPLPLSGLLLLLLLGGGLAGAEEEEGAPAPLGADLDWAHGSRRAYKPRGIDLSPPPPEAPALTLDDDEQALHGRLAAGSLSVRVATVASKAGYRLWMDADFDGDLAEERPVHFQSRGSTWEAPVVLAVPGEPGTAPVRLPALLYRMKKRTSKRLYFLVPAHRAGSIVLEGRLRAVEVHDTDGDLRYGVGEHDACYVDVDGDGLLDKSTKSMDRIRPGTPFAIRASGYRAAVVGRMAAALTFERLAEMPPPQPGAWAPWRVPSSNRASTAAPAVLADAKALYRKAQTAGQQERTFLYQLRSLLRQVGRVGTDDAFSFLYQLVRASDDPRLQLAAVAAMANASYARHGSKVAKIARGAKNPNLRKAAIRTLHAMNAPGRDKVLAGIARRTKDDGVFAEAVKHLAYTRTELAQKTLTELVRRRVRPARHKALYEAATRYAAQPPPREIVEAATRSQSAAVRALAFADAQRVDPVLAHQLALEFAAGAGADAGLRLAVVRDLATWGDAASVKAVLPLSQGLERAARGRLVDHLRLVRSPAATRVLLQGLRAPPPATRALVADVLAGMGDPQAGPALVAALARERDESAVVALARAIERHRPAHAVDAIIAAARKHASNVDVQEATLRALGRIGFDEPSVARFFTERLKASAWVDRVLALEAAGESGSHRAAALLLDGLDDGVWQVRLAAAQGLGKVRVKQAVLPLIARLEAETDNRVRIGVEEALFRTTGQHLYDVAERWRLWWADHGVGFEVPGEIPARPDVAPDTRYATFYGLPVRSDRVVFVIDKSGSMGSTPYRGRRGAEPDAKNNLQLAVQETLKVARKLGSGAKANVVLFESGVTAWHKGLEKLDGRAQKALKTYLEKQQPSGGTNLFDAVERALKMKHVEEIYLLSDGVPSAGRFQRTEDIVREVQRLNRRRRIVIHCVALGHSSDLLERLAADSGGTYVSR